MRTLGQGGLKQQVSLVVLAGVACLFGLLFSGCSTSIGGSDAATTTVSAKGVDASPGCSLVSRRPTPKSSSTAGTAPLPFKAAGESGSYLIDTPTERSSRDPLPLVFDLHGYQETAAEQDVVSGLGAYGAAHGFVTVTPEVQYTVPRWDYAPGSADRAFLVALIDRIEATRCVDLQRVFMAGYSNGAFTTSSMVCELGDRLAAVATISGIQAPTGCHPKRPVPVIAFHGTADPLVPYNGGLTSEALALPAPDGKGTMGSVRGTPEAAGIMPLTAPIPTELARWASRNHCAEPPTVSKAAAGVALIAYRCPNHATVELYREDGDGHTWPGSRLMTLAVVRATLGVTTLAINADQLMWAFFQAHPLDG